MEGTSATFLAYSVQVRAQKKYLARKDPRNLGTGKKKWSEKKKSRSQLPVSLETAISVPLWKPQVRMTLRQVALIHAVYIVNQ